MHSLGLKAIRDGSQQAAKYNKSARNSTVMDDPETVSASRLGPEDRFIVGDQVCFCVFGSRRRAIPIASYRFSISPILTCQITLYDGPSVAASSIHKVTIPELSS